MIVAFSVQPTGAPSDPSLTRHLGEGADGASVHDAVAAAVRVVRESGLPTRTSALFTEIEGEWDEAMEGVRRATAEAGGYGARVVRESGLPTRTSAMFTEIEGEWDEVMEVVRRATAEAGRYGSRVSLVLKADIRPGHDGELDGKVRRMEQALGELGG